MNQLTEYSDLLTFGTETIQNDIMTHSANQCMVGFRAAEAEQEAFTARHARKVIEAEVYLDERAAAEEVKERVTETILSSRVAVTKRVKQAYIAEHNAMLVNGKWKELSAAYHTRSILLATAAKFTVSNGG